MQTIKEKMSNAASSCKAHVDIYKSKAEEKAEKATARTEEEKEIAYHRRKAKEAKAKMELHQAKAEHADEKLRSKQSHSHLCCPNLIAGAGTGTNEPPVVATQGHHPAGIVADPMTGKTAVLTNPLGGNPLPPRHNNKHNIL